jgi:peptide/nickel transport system ATP-binding protein
MRAYRRKLQIVFQDPFSSLNPRLKVAAILSEALDACGFPRGKARRERIAELLTLVGLSPDHAARYPHEFSGGQRQRIGIARALAVQPEFVVADEPVSALDVSVQAQVLNLLGELQKKLGLTLLFIAHDLSVVEYLCDEVVVLYLGRVMERGPSKLVYAAPRHPYTKALLATAPVPDPTRVRTHVPLKGDIPSPIAPPSGCVFRTRCPEAIAACAQTVPPVVEIGGGHHVACIRHDGRT